MQIYRENNMRLVLLMLGGGIAAPVPTPQNKQSSAKKQKSKKVAVKISRMHEVYTSCQYPNEATF